MRTLISSHALMFLPNLPQWIESVVSGILVSKWNYLNGSNSITVSSHINFTVLLAIVLSVLVEVEFGILSHFLRVNNG